MIQKQNFFTVFKDSFNFARKGQFETIFPQPINDTKYYYYESDCIVNAKVFRIGFCTGQSEVIFLEEGLPGYVKEFTLYHEVGHKELHNKLLLDTKLANKITKERRKGSVHHMEFEADQYAVNIVGIEKSVMALRFILTISKNKHFVNELKSRLSALERML